MSAESEVIYVGRKPVMNYVQSIIISFTGSNVKEVTLKARGRSISTAVDAAEIARINHSFDRFFTLSSSMNLFRVTVLFSQTTRPVRYREKFLS